MPNTLITGWMDEVIRYGATKVITDPGEIALELERADPALLADLREAHPDKAIRQLKVELTAPATAIWAAFSDSYQARAYKVA